MVIKKLWKILVSRLVSCFGKSISLKKVDIDDLSSDAFHIFHTLGCYHHHGMRETDLKAHTGSFLSGNVDVTAALQELRRLDVLDESHPRIIKLKPGVVIDESAYDDEYLD